MCEKPSTSSLYVVEWIEDGCCSFCCRICLDVPLLPSLSVWVTNSSATAGGFRGSI